MVALPRDRGLSRKGTCLALCCFLILRELTRNHRRWRMLKWPEWWGGKGLEVRLERKRNKRKTNKQETKMHSQIRNVNGTIANSGRSAEGFYLIGASDVAKMRCSCRREGYKE